MKVTFFVFSFLFCVVIFSSSSVCFAREVKLTDVQERCVICHSADRICARLTDGKTIWEPIVERMASNGASLSAREILGVSRLLDEQPQTVASVLRCASAAGDMEQRAQGRNRDIPLLLALAHPTIMILVFFLSLWVANQGVNRARFVLWGQKVKFDWKGHVRYGVLVMAVWALGMVAGSLVANMLYGASGMTGTHQKIAMVMLPLILFGAGSGLYMRFKKAPRKVLPLFHGANNLVLVVLAFLQLVTGYHLVVAFF
ncbi:hypothetical protein GO013_12015 [Pseudodesulfovibrio sp. JC047]|uniref:hypothetical protein n=1 Tax=Pseudodesulfovibrio sp. JC047 TaxID=2683199 RepID=UPI0013CFDA7F|nr:hypothetical protein [Pseudodesulfovibrio sp. JC047]NDV20140.1 hypothetical protein [Pseudodesulfovibrio sp. JC047]